jgi:regulator of PEP synthase PpsR (kinase-PPPase family)
MEYMAPGRRMSYDEEDRVREEVAWCRRICGRHGIRLVDVTQKAIEETAHQVVSLLLRYFPDPRRTDVERDKKRA